MRIFHRHPNMDYRRPAPRVLGAAAALLCLALAARAAPQSLEDAPAATAPPAPPSAATDASEPECTLRPGPARTVTRVIDAETVLLDDGKELRLAGILAPRARDAGANPGAWPAEENAKAALAAQILGKEIGLAYARRSSDRYGRYSAHAFLQSGGTRTWVQGELLARGHARAAALPGDGLCLEELLAHENLARTTGTGLWALRLYGAKDAARAPLLMAYRASFQIVRGRVTGISETRDALYFNFGGDWKSDFTVRVPRRVTARDPSLAGKLRALAGQLVEVRGWIERRNGPMITIEQPGEITSIESREISGRDGPGAQSGAHDQGKTAEAVRKAKDLGLAESAPFDGTPPDDEGAINENRPEADAPGDLDL